MLAGTPLMMLCTPMGLPAASSARALITASVVVTLMSTLVAAQLPRGAAPEDYAIYTRRDGMFVCREDALKAEASKDTPHPQLHFSAVNDDYCDCLDGSDEPGTAACALGRFYCRNVGSVPQVLPSAFLNDGVCDCCDGSDEWSAEPPAAQCNAEACAAEAAGISSRLARLLDTESEGEHLSAAAAVAMPVHLEQLQSKFTSVAAEALPLNQELEAKVKEINALEKKQQKEAKSKKPPKPADISGGIGRTPAYCYPVGQAKDAEYHVRENETFEVNVSCIEAKACHYLCSLYCQDSRAFNGSCVVIDLHQRRKVLIDFDPDALAREQMMAKYYGSQMNGPKLEEIAIEYMVPVLGYSVTEVKWLEGRQELIRLQRVAEPIFAMHQKLQTQVRQIKQLSEQNQLGPDGVYHSLQGECLNVTQEQYVGTTAVREQWHTFHYDICFFEHATQHEVKAAPDHAAAYDESGAMAAQSEEIEPERIVLGQPVGFVGKGQLDLSRLGLEAPLFFTPSEHVFLFAGGGQCPGGTRRALAVQFTCGSEPALVRVTEARQCSYLAEVSHPGPCDLDAWPPLLREMAREANSFNELEAGIKAWLPGVAASLRIDDGPLDWGSAFTRPREVQEMLLARLGPGPAPPLITLVGVQHVATRTKQLFCGILQMGIELFSQEVGHLPEMLPPEVSHNVLALVAQARAELERLSSSLLPSGVSGAFRSAQAALGLEKGFAAALATLATLAEALKAQEQVAAALSRLSMHAEAFEKRRPVGRRYSTSSVPSDLMVLAVHLAVIHLVIFRIIRWVWRTLNVMCYCLCCCFCCCACCCSRRSRGDGLTLLDSREACMGSATEEADAGEDSPEGTEERNVSGAGPEDDWAEDGDNRHGGSELDQAESG